MPTFYDSQHARLTFDTTEIELWLRRLRILYQIDKGRIYGGVIDSILGLLQFIPAALLVPVAHVTRETYLTDEIMLNDIARARMYLLEEWATDGDPFRSVGLTDSYRTLSPSVLATMESAAPKLKDDEPSDKPSDFDPFS